MISARAAPGSDFTKLKMILLPDFNEAFSHENNFYLSCDSTRIAKLIAQYELFKLSIDVPGAIIECGVFKGVSLARFAHFREILSPNGIKEIIGFDTFGKFPDSTFEPDNDLLEKFVQSAGNMSIGKDQMTEVLQKKGLDHNVKLIEGDIMQTIPQFVNDNPGLTVSFLNLDVDLYEPSRVILEYLYPCLAKGGVLLLDDYGKFPGETKAVDDYFAGKDVAVKHLPYVKSPCYIIKD